MARTAAAGFWSQARACVRTARHCLERLFGRPSSLAAALALIGLTFSGACRAENPVRGEANFVTAGGYARLVIKLSQDVGTEVTTAGSILVIRFDHPVDVPVDKLPDAAPDYVGSARRDPDGSAIRLSLARRVTVNTMTAGERVFVDLLPESWSGPPPSLPQEVIRELAERARAAERALRLQRAASEAQKRPPIRVRTSVQPTFVRFVFEMPDGVGVSSVLNDQKLTLLFNGLLTFDLADAKEAAPANVASINQKTEGDRSAIELALIGDVDVHSFREEKNYIIDVAFQQAQKPPEPPAHTSDASHARTPAAAAAAVKAAQAATEKHGTEKPAADKHAMEKLVAVKPVAEKPAAEPAAPPRRSQESREIAPPSSELIAKEANIEIKPEAVQEPSSGSESPKQEPSSQETPAPVAEAPPQMKFAAAAPPAEVKAGDSTASVSARRDSDGLRLMFSFAAATPAALFRHADAVWLVFDAAKPIDVEPIRSKGGSIVSDVSSFSLDKGQAIRIRLNRPQLPSLTSEDEAGTTNWTLTFAETMRTPSQPLVAIRNIADPSLANVTVPLARPGGLHRLVDPDAGDTIMVVTAPAPVRGFIKRQDFVEMSLLESVHGVAVRPNSDDVTVEVAPDKIIIGKPGGLTLSSAEVGSERATAAVRPVFDGTEWSKAKEGDFIPRLDELVAAAGAAEPGQRTPARLDVARFYMSRGMYPEAKGVLDVILSGAKSGLDDPSALVMRAVVNSLVGHPEKALKDLSNPAIGANYDSQLWKALAYARQEKWSEAREKFKNVELAVPMLPVELQRIVDRKSVV